MARHMHSARRPVHQVDCHALGGVPCATCRCSTHLLSNCMPGETQHTGAPGVAEPGGASSHLRSQMPVLGSVFFA